MAQTTGTSEDIIERRESNPVATSCLVLAAICLIGAILLQLMEIGQQKRTISESDAERLASGTYMSNVSAQIDRDRKKVQAMIDEAMPPADYVELYEEIISGGSAGASSSGGGGDDVFGDDDSGGDVFGDDDSGGDVFGDDDDDDDDSGGDVFGDDDDSGGDVFGDDDEDI